LLLFLPTLVTLTTRYWCDPAVPERINLDLQWFIFIYCVRSPRFKTL